MWNFQQMEVIEVLIVVVYSEMNTETIREKYGLPPKCRMSSRLLTALCEMRINPTIQQLQTVMCPLLLTAKIQQFRQLPTS